MANEHEDQQSVFVSKQIIFLLFLSEYQENRLS